MLRMIIFGIDIRMYLGGLFDLVVYMICFDVITGILASAKNRRLSSSISFNGLIRKLGLVVGIAFMGVVDRFLHTDGEILKVGSLMIVTTESMSIIENFSLIGVKLDFLTQYFSGEKVGRK